MDATAIVGAVGAAASVASFTPQAWKIIRARKTEGLSAWMYGLTALAFAAWGLFGILNGEWTMIVPNAICLAFALFIMVMTLLPKAKTAELANALDPSDSAKVEQSEG